MRQLLLVALLTAPVGAAGLNEHRSQNFGVNYALSIPSTTHLAGGLVIGSNGRVRLPAGSVGAPVIAPHGAYDSGLYFPGGGTAISVGGVFVSSFSASGLNVAGAVGAGSFYGIGSLLTDLNASFITLGTLANARLDSTSVTLQGNAFNAANQLLRLDGNALVPNANLDASSVTKQGNAFNGASQLLRLDGSALVSNANLDASSVTLQGNLFNGALQLVRLDASGFLPALNGSALTNLNASALATGEVPNARLNAAVSLLGQTIDPGEVSHSTFTFAGVVSSGGVAGSYIDYYPLGVAPAAARGRVYFDPTALGGDGALKVSLDGAAFVALSTAPGGGGGGLTGTGTANRAAYWTSSTNLAAADNLVIDAGGSVTVTSTATVQGNAFSVGGSTLVVVSGQVGVGTANPATTLDISGSLQAGAGALKSTFTATPGAGVYAIEASSGARLNNGGPLELTSGGYVRWPDGTISTTAASGGGGGGGTPGGANGQVQYNNAGAFGGATGLYVGSPGITFTSTATFRDAVEVRSNAAVESAIMKISSQNASTILFQVNGSGNWGFATTPEAENGARVRIVGGTVLLLEGSGVGGNPNMRLSNTTQTFGFQTTGARQHRFELQDFTAGTARLSVETNGNVGIGIGQSSYAGTLLHISSGIVTIDGTSPELRVEGAARFGSPAFKSTFTATPGAGTFALTLSSGVSTANGGPVKVSNGGYIEFGDGTRQATASTGGTADGNSVVFISSISANNSASRDVLLPGTFDEYEIRMSSVTASSLNSDLLLRVGTGATPTYQTTSYRWHAPRVASDGTAYNAEVSDSDSAVKVADAVSDFAGGGHVSGKIKISNVKSGSLRKGMEVDHVNTRSSGNRIQGGKGVGLWDGGTDQITAIRFLFDSGNIEFGEFVLYGIKKSQ